MPLVVRVAEAVKRSYLLQHLEGRTLSLVARFRTFDMGRHVVALYCSIGPSTSHALFPIYVYLCFIFPFSYSGHGG